MEIVRVLVAAAGSWVFGAVWYMALAKPWMAAAGVECDENGRPKNGSSPLPFVLSALCMILVAGHDAACDEHGAPDHGNSGIDDGFWHRRLLHRAVDHDQQRLCGQALQVDAD